MGLGTYPSMPSELSGSRTTEAFASLGRILSVMLSRTARWFATALVAFLFAQPIPILAFASDDSAMSCCHDGMSCCRRSHHHSSNSGPEFSSRDCCERCQVAVRQSQPVAESVAPSAAFAEFAPAISSPPAPSSWISWVRRDAALFQRPPPSSI